MKPLPDLKVTGEAVIVTAAPLKRREKLKRWADVLENHPDRIRSFDSIELLRPVRRGPMRQDDSALALAYADPVLRDAGLAGDSYADGRDFFELSHSDMHKLMCRCHIGSSEPGRVTADRVRRLMRTSVERASALFRSAGRLFRPAYN